MASSIFAGKNGLLLKFPDKTQACDGICPAAGTPVPSGDVLTLDVEGCQGGGIQVSINEGATITVTEFPAQIPYVVGEYGEATILVNALDGEACVFSYWTNTPGGPAIAFYNPFYSYYGPGGATLVAHYEPVGG